MTRSQAILRVNVKHAAACHVDVMTLYTEIVMADASANPHQRANYVLRHVIDTEHGVPAPAYAVLYKEGDIEDTIIGPESELLKILSYRARLMSRGPVPSQSISQLMADNAALWALQDEIILISSVPANGVPAPAYGQYVVLEHEGPLVPTKILPDVACMNSRQSPIITERQLYALLSYRSHQRAIQTWTTRAQEAYRESL